MSRRHETKPNLALRDAKDDKYSFTAELEFITPVFGGGVELTPQPNAHIKKPDDITPVRGASLRGQLREWWRRACCEGIPLSEMREREAELWGAASKKGLVSLAIDMITLVGQPLHYQDLPTIKYGTFPIQAPQGRQDHGSVTKYTGKFSVRISLDERRAGPEMDARWEEVQRAWLAFVTFGGLGARTRRGFGAVRIVGGDKTPVGLQTVLSTLGWTSRAAFFTRTTSPARVHEEAIRKLQEFRQGTNGQGKARNPGDSKPHRSLWPEPDYLRALRGQPIPPNRARMVHVEKFPRAAFGLPIIFQRIDGGTPTTYTLEPPTSDRLASPLILRPVCEPDGRTVLGVVLQVHDRVDLSQTLSKLKLKEKAGKVYFGILSPQEAAQINPLRHFSARATTSVNLVYEPFFNAFRK